MAGVENSPSVHPSRFIETDRIQSNCGLFAVVLVNNASTEEDLKTITLFAGASLQHRAEGGAGYAVFNENGEGQFVRNPGRIDVAFQDGKLIPRLEGERIAILHTRYPTAGGSEHAPNIQPLTFDGITLAHHGNLTNAEEVKAGLGDIEMGGAFPDNDSWIALNAIVRAEGHTLAQKMINAQKIFEGGWAFIATDGKDVVASRDPQGVRPLSLAWVGSEHDADAYFLSVETSPFSRLGVEGYRDLLPGETILIDGGDAETVDLSTDPEQRSCIFETVYMMHPDSKYMGQEIYKARRLAGHLLWQEQPVELRPSEKLLVMPVPDSGRPSALGYYNEARKYLGDKVGWEEGLLINRYLGRSFIKPTGNRDPSLKFFEIRDLVVDKKIVLVDDSLVRGDTMKGIVQMLKDAGAREVHVRLASPPIVRPCHWGVAVPTYKELAAVRNPDVDDRARLLEMDSLGYLSLEALYEACGADEEARERFCAHCFGGASPRMNGDRPGTIPLVESTYTK